MVKYVYTLSSVGVMFQRAFFSIKSLSKYVDPKNIVVFFTPPRDNSDTKRLEQLGVDLRLVENTTDAFTAFDTEQHYGEKTWLTTIEDDTVVFLDCDTVIFDDIQTVIKGDFDFKARPGTSEVLQPNWRDLFERFDEEYLDWMPNAGFLVFKNGLHREIGDKWRKYIQTDLNYQHRANHKEQYALALSVGNSNVEKMTSKEHVMLWNDEYPASGVVYHIGNTIEEKLGGGSLTLKRDIFYRLRKMF